MNKTKQTIIWHASQEHLDGIPIFDAWEIKNGVFFLQHVGIVRLHTLLLDYTWDVFVRMTHCKLAVGIDL